jgi:hypothetical protein
MVFYGKEENDPLLMMMKMKKMVKKQLKKVKKIRNGDKRRHIGLVIPLI